MTLLLILKLFLKALNGKIAYFPDRKREQTLI